MNASELALFAFTACNTLRVVAYVPQILKIARDDGGAAAISYSTWGLFGVSHLSTVAYALATLQDWKLAFIFTANAAACAAIISLTIYKRLRFAARMRLPGSFDRSTHPFTPESREAPAEDNKVTVLRGSATRARRH